MDTSVGIRIGLEVHLQVTTGSKLFTDEPAMPAGAPADPEPNTRTGPYSLGHPGTYPVCNRAVIEAAVRLGLALECTIASESRFDRKHYAYPDLPRGYQITQHAHPICTDGRYVAADRPDAESVRIRRIHMEEDAARLRHFADRTLVDYNRAGIPLLEIVTEPDFCSPGDASDFLRDLRTLVRTLSISDGRMEQGSMRCDANISVEGGGGRVEIKNMNSFRHVEQALAYEADRQASAVRSGSTVLSETRRFDADTGQTHSMRFKETRPDYRFVPDPDLPVVRVDRSLLDRLRRELPARPDQLRRELVTTYGLQSDWARLMAEQPWAATLFRNAAGLARDDSVPRLAALVVDVVLTREHSGVDPAYLAGVANLQQAGRINSNAAVRLIDYALEHDAADAEKTASQLDLIQISDEDALRSAIQDAIGEHPGEWRRYVAGKTGLRGFFIGHVMRAFGGAGDPQKIARLIEERAEQTD